jgi:hypothetical protein
MKAFCLLIILSLGFSAQFVFGSEIKKVLLVSDIDDTLKMSHVLSKISAVKNAPNITAAFSGMSQLYRLLSNQYHADLKIVYLSNAIEQISGIPALKILHQNFLDYNKFPSGDLNLRQNIGDQNHKIDELRLLIKSERPDAVILVGDNGERDSAIYHQLILENQASGIHFVTFIHQLYSSKSTGFHFFAETGTTIAPEQFGYVTPIEIALQLNQEQLLSNTNTQWMLDNMLPFIVRQSGGDYLGEDTFPSFENCSDFVWRWAVTAQINPLLEKIKNRCR